MPVMQDSLSVAANAVSANVLAGLLHEFLGRQAAKLTLLATGSAIGLRVTLLVGGRAVVNDQAIGLQNRFPITPDDLILSAGALPGERMVLTFRNTTGGALTAFWQVQVRYV
jgi:hypothetical protein